MAIGVKIVVIEDHDASRTSIVAALQNAGYDARGIGCAEDLHDEVAGQPFDLLILTLDLPGEGGLSLAKRIRAVQPDVGIIIMTANATSDDRILGYQSGADLSLPKPVSMSEMCAAIEALSRRMTSSTHPQASPTPDETQNLAFLDQRSLHLSHRECSVLLSYREAKLLVGLARAPRRQLETWQVMQTQSEDETYSKGALEVSIARLRKKLSDVGLQSSSLQAIRGHGYKLTFSLQLI